MTQIEILHQLRHLMKQSSQEKLDWETIGPEATIRSLGFDSLSILDLVYDIQQHFSVEFDAEELTQIDTVGKLAAFLEPRLPT